MTDAPGESDGEILRRLEDLTNLCVKRFRDDWAHKAAIEALTEQLHAAEHGAFRMSLHPFVVGTAMVIDRLDRYSGSDSDLATSIRDDLLEVLEHHGVREVPAGGVFNPMYHEAVQTRSVPSVPPGTIVELVRRGFLYGDWVFRAALVIVNR